MAIRIVVFVMIVAYYDANNINNISLESASLCAAKLQRSARSHVARQLRRPHVLLCDESRHSRGGLRDGVWEGGEGWWRDVERGIGSCGGVD